MRRELRPGDLGELARLHGVLYAADEQLDVTFEAGVAKGLADAVLRGWPDHDEGLWVAERDGRMLGAIGLTREGPRHGRLRWFLLVPEARGRGLGRRLLGDVLAFTRAAGYERLELDTYPELRAAGRLYVEAGFHVIASRRTEIWGRTLEVQRYELELPARS